MKKEVKKELEEILQDYEWIGMTPSGWKEISWVEILSEDFMREFKYSVDWEAISIHQFLSEDFIREFKDKVDWEHISIYQDLSDDFIREFEDELNLDIMFREDIIIEKLYRELTICSRYKLLDFD